MKSLKRVLCVCLTLAMLLSMLPLSVYAAADMKLTADAVSAKMTAGSQVKVNVTMSGNPGLTYGSVDVGFEKEKFKLVGIENQHQTITEGYNGEESFPVTSGEYTLSWGNFLKKDNFTGNGVIATLVFEVLDTATVGDSAVQLSTPDFYNADGDEVGTVCGNGKIALWAELSGFVGFNLEKPRKGGTPQTSVKFTTVTGTVYYTGTVTWLTDHTTFAPGTEYTANVALTPSTGYKFVPSGANKTQISYPDGTVSNLTVAADGSSLTFTVSFAATASADRLGGTVTIDGATDGKAKFGDTLTATPNLNYGNETLGTLDYRWMRDDKGIANATHNNTYTTVEADIGHKISVEVSNSNNTGSVTSDPVTIGKALNGTNPDAPSVGFDGLGQTSITVTYDYEGDYEFACVEWTDDYQAGDISGAVWQDSKTFTGLKPNTPYYIYVRVKATATHEASTAAYTTANTARYEVAIDADLKAKLDASVSALNREYNYGWDYPIEVVDQRLPAGWSYSYSTDGRNFSTSKPATIRDVSSSGKYYVKFEHHDYKAYIAEFDVTIRPKVITPKDGVNIVKARYDEPTYTGSAVTPTNLVLYWNNRVQDVTLTVGEHKDVTIAYSDNINRPNGTITVTAVEGGNYTGSCNVYFTINPKTITPTIAPIASVTHTGGKLTPYISVRTESGSALTLGKDYTATYTDNEDVGTATVTLHPVSATEGRSNYTFADNTYTANFQITKATHENETGTATVASGKATTGVTYILPLLPADASYGMPVTSGALISTASVDGNRLTYSTTVQADGTQGTIELAVTGAKNYLDYTFTLTVTAKDRDPATVTITSDVPTEKTYGDLAFKITATAVDADGKALTDGKWSWSSTDRALHIVPTSGKPGEATVSIQSACEGGATITATYESETHIGSETTATIKVLRKEVTITGVTVANKQYDALTTARITGYGTVSGAKDGDAVSVNYNTGVAAFADKNVGENKTVNITGMELWGARAADYKLVEQPTATANITAKPVTVTIIVSDKDYDGTTDATVASATVNAKAMASDEVTVDTGKLDAKFADKDAGENKAVHITNVMLTGADARNYSVDATYDTSATIRAKNLTGTNTTNSTSLLMKSSGAFADPVIDGVNNEKLTSENGTFTYSYTSPAGKVTGAEAISSALRALNTVKDYSVSYTFTPNAGSNYTGTVTGTLTVSVKDIEFFKPNSDPIHPAETLLTVTNGIYNAGKADAYVSFPAGITAKVDGTTISGKFYVTVDGLADGAKVPAGTQKFRLRFDSNDGAYNGVEVCAMRSATIYPASIEIDGSKIKVADRAYDGTTTVSASQVDLSGLKMHIKDGEKTSAIANGEDITLSYTATYDEANAGDRLVEFSNLTLTGADKDNYTLYNSYSFKVSAKITKAIVTIDVADSGITVAPREYDGTINGTQDQVDLTVAKLKGVLEAEKANVALAQNPFSIIYSSKAAGSAIATLGNLVLTGTAAKNYELKDDAIPVQTSITQRTIAITSIEVADKTYDGTTTATVKNVVYGNVVSGDQVYANITARFDNANADTNKSVTYDVVSWQGKDADNYTFDGNKPSATASIAKAKLVGAPAFDKVTKAGITLREFTDAGGVITAGVRGVNGENVSYQFIWTDREDTVIEANKSYAWTLESLDNNYEDLTGSTVLYPVSTSYSDQVKKQSEEFEAKKRGELPEDELDFRDVYEDDYFFDAVQWAAENGITGGVGNGRFGPNLDCSRGQTMTFLWRASGEPEPDSFSTDLTDVKSGDYFYEAVLWAMEEGVTTGAGGNRFAPDATVTRGQFVTFLYRLANASSDGVHPFADVPAGSYYEKAIAWAFAEGITRGTSGTTFSPDAPCTRAQIITFLYRYFNR